MTFQPIDPIELVQLTEHVRVSGLRHDQARFLVAKLAATENERQRLQAQVDDAGERRRGLRSMMTDEAQKTRDELEAAKKRIAELEVPRNLRELQQQSAGDAFLDCVGPSVNPYGIQSGPAFDRDDFDRLTTEQRRFVETMEQQRNVDAQTREMAAEIVAGQDPKTLDEAKAFAQRWIETAAQESRNADYYKTERDKLEADLQRLRALIDGAHI